ncbi:MAG: rhomboid family intramembrane serine protease [Lewinella sp.]|nr:rhomboid family intramembrane serine protease [Lewinella sp.]
MGLSLTLIIVIMTGLISYQAFNNPEMRAKLMFRPVDIKNHGEYYRFITSGFIHADWGHLLVNMYVLYVFGEQIEQIFTSLLFGPVYGRIAYIGFYLTAIIVANIPSYFRHQDNYGYSALGASGATSALVFAIILFIPWEWFLFPPLPAILVAVTFLWYSSYMDKRGADNIGHNAHFWGAVYGLLFIIVASWLMQPSLIGYFIDQLAAGPKAPNFF